MSNDNNLTEINQIFAERFLSAYREIKRRKKSRILNYLSSIYRRWYYSALIEDTLLSPANMVLTREKANSKEPAAILAPVARFAGNSRAKITFDVLEYSLENHPIIDDLNIFMESCTPDVELSQDDMLADKHIESLMDKLSLWDSFYVEYLMNIAIVLGLIEKSPSIYSNRAQITNRYKKMREKPRKEQFGMIVSASIESAASFISEMIPLPELYFTPERIFSLLVDPIPMDDVFQHIYSILGIKIQDIYDDEDDEIDPFIDDLNNAVISSTFLLGLLIDKCFLTPFGYYLRLIRPLYTLPFEFINELNYLLDTFEDDEGPVTALYAPAAFYQLTQLGAEYFEVNVGDGNVVTTNIRSDELPFILKGGDTEKFERLKREFSIIEESGHVIYVLKARLADDKSIWKNIESPGNMNLYQLCSEICYQFCFISNPDFSFFADISKSPFSEYSNIKTSKLPKKDPGIRLDDLGFEEKHRFTLILYNSHNVFNVNSVISKRTEIELEVIKKKAREDGTVYPRVARTSAALRELEEGRK
ncbi:MAG: hypothetical protein LBQ68_09265 [Clostridiales bacterium]|jgi:hypothetical protein|nr:hypothetical protein [Clostridiales bacterium]